MRKINKRLSKINVGWLIKSVQEMKELLNHYNGDEILPKFGSCPICGGHFGCIDCPWLVMKGMRCHRYTRNHLYIAHDVVALRNGSSRRWVRARKRHLKKWIIAYEIAIAKKTLDSGLPEKPFMAVS